MTPASHQYATWAELGAAALTFFSLLFITAPYGRHTSVGWGPTIESRTGWVVMELPTLLVFIPLYLQGQHAQSVVPLVFLGLWLVHYIHRTLVFPFRLRTPKRPMPLVIALMGALFNTLNAAVIAPQLSQFGSYGASWLGSPQFLVGLALFSSGYIINRHSDHILLRLRAPGQSGYQIPYGGLYNLVSCPNYLGEIIQWTGFANATWSMPALAFALYTAANVGPRAMSNHRWYRATFENYPPSRRALLPKIL